MQALGGPDPCRTVLLGYPELADRIERVVAVAGRRPNDEFRPGRGGIALRDLNFESDPNAFRVVLRSEVPIVLVPYDAGRRVWVTTSDLGDPDGGLRGRTGPGVAAAVGPRRPPGYTFVITMTKRG